MWLEEKTRLEGIVAPGGTPSWTDLVRDSYRAQQYVENTNARARAIEEAYDARIDAIEKAGGVRFTNPFRAPPPGAMVDRVTGKALGMPADQQTFDQGEPRPDAYAAFDAELKKFAEQRPDLIDVIKPNRSPIEDAREKARQVDRELSENEERYRGPWGAAGAAHLVGGLLGSWNDPLNIATMAIGPSSRAGAGLKGMLWMASKQALANATGTAIMQPEVANWRKEAGLEYNFSTFASNVGTAAAFGGLLDFGVRGASRGIRALRGHVPILDEAGGVRGWEPAEYALERAALQSKADTIRAALDGDPRALRKLAEGTEAIKDPVVRSALDMLDDTEVTSTRSRGINPHLDDEAATQAMRHLADPYEPPPVDLEPAPLVLYRADREGATYTTSFERAAAQAGDAGISRVEVPHDRAGKLKRGEVEGDYHLPQDLAATGRPVTPEVAALRQKLHDGELTTLQAAVLMRETPQVVDSELPLSTQAMRDAHALARLSDAAFDMVVRGVVSPEAGAAVARLAKKARHADVLGDLSILQPRDAKEMRHLIGELSQEDWNAPQARRRGFEIDPLGYEVLDDDALVSAGLQAPKRGTPAAGLNDQQLAQLLANELELRGYDSRPVINADRSPKLSRVEMEKMLDQVQGEPIPAWHELREMEERQWNSGDRGVDDPGGPDGVRQIEALEKALGVDSERWKLEQAKLPESVREALDEVPEMSLKAQLDEVEGLEKMLDVLEHCKF